MHSMFTRAAGSSRKARQRQLGLALLVLVYVWGFLGSAWHESTASHAVCEHGLLVHVEQDSSASPADRDAAAQADPRSPSPGYTSGRTRLGHDHVHCTIAAPFSLPAPDASPLGEARALPQVALESCTDQTLEVSGFPLYLLAPNHSPPAA